MSALFEPTTLTKTQQSNSQQQQLGSSGGTTAGTTSSTPTLSPELQQLMQQLMAYGNQSMTNPTAALQPIRAAGLQQVNQAYSDVPNQVTAQLARRGYGSSGSMGDSLYKTGLARAGAVSGLEGQLANLGIQQQQFGAGLGERLLESLKGTSTSSSGTGSYYDNKSMTGSSSGTETTPGPSVFSSIAGLFGSLAGLGTGTVGGGLLGNALSSILKPKTSSTSSTTPTSYGGGWGDFGNEYTP